jgi:hypothetical protein
VDDEAAVLAGGLVQQRSRELKKEEMIRKWE